MKKAVFFVIFLTSFLSLWAVWEGNAEIGGNGNFSSTGLFVRSDMFPKHTLLEITNLEKNITARAVVIGSSGIPGLLLSISPELGSKLAIPRGKVVRIRVIIPSPVQEIGDDGLSFVPVSQNEDIQNEPAIQLASNSEPVVGPAPVVEPKPAPVVEAVPEVVAVEEPQPAEEPIKEPEPVVEPVPEVAAVEEPQPVEEPIEEPAPVEEPIKEETVTYLEPADMRPPKVVDKISKPKNKTAKKPSPVKKVGTPKKPAEKKEELDKSSVKNIGKPNKPTPAAKQKDAPVPMAPELGKPPAKKRSAQKKPDEVYSVVTPEPVIAEEPLVDEALAVEEEPVMEETPEPAEEPEPIVEEAPVIAKSPVVEADPEIYTISELEKEEPIREEPKPKNKTKLEKGRLYVQIVAYTEKDQAETIISKYNKQYPMVLEEKQGRKSRQYLVFIGPLNPEESGAVREYFRRRGFKDAFIKKAK